MTGNIIGKRPKAPWHFWVLALSSLLWFSGGVNDYVQTKLLNMDYLSMAAQSMDVPVEVVIDYFSAYPLWANICWAFGVWGAFAGSLLMLLRSRFAYHALISSILGLVGSTLYTFTSDIPAQFLSATQLVFTVVIWLSVLGMAWYVKMMTKMGVLR